MFVQEPESRPEPTRHVAPDVQATTERIAPPSSRLQYRTKPSFNAQAWWAIALGAVVLLYIGVALLFQSEYNANTTTVFNDVTEQARMPWYHQNPWFGALFFAALPGLAFAWTFVTLMQTKFHVIEQRTELSDLNLSLQHTGYRLQAQLDHISAKLDKT